MSATDEIGDQQVVIANIGKLRDILADLEDADGAENVPLTVNDTDYREAAAFDAQANPHDSGEA